MIKSKRKGSIIIEALLLVNIAVLLVGVGMKHIVAGIEKSKYYNVRSNLLELTDEEKRLISEVVLDIKENKDIHDKIISQNSIIDIEYKKSYSGNENLWLEIYGGKAYIVTSKYNSKRYKKLDVKIKVNEDIEEIIFIPTMYRSDYISK